MKKEKENNKQVNRVIIMVLLVISLILFFAIRAESQEIKTGYSISIEVALEKPIIRKARTEQQAQVIINQYYPKSSLKLSEMMRGGFFFEIHSYDFRFYVELMKVVTRNGKVKCRKLSKKDRKLLNTQKLR